MPRIIDHDDQSPEKQAAKLLGIGLGTAFALGGFAFVLALISWNSFLIDVPQGHMAVMIRKTGIDLTNADEVAPTADHKGIQKDVLTEGRYFRNPFVWQWEVIKQTEIPAGKVGVVTRLHGKDLAPGEIIAREPDQKGIIPGYRQGRYPLNPYLELIEFYDVVRIPAGYRAVVTNLTGELPSKPEHFSEVVGPLDSKQLLVKAGYRGVQEETMSEGDVPLNPFEKSVALVDVRSQRFNLSQSQDMGFPSKDGFWISLDGVIEFRIRPERAAYVYVVYNETHNGDRVDEEVIQKVIMPTARSFCRLQGSNNLGREFISGISRTKFQDDFQRAMRAECEPLGIEIINALITRIRPPEQIAKPVRDREIARQQEKQYQQQILQQRSEQQLAVERELVKQKQALVAAEQEVVRVVSEAMREQEVAITKANERLVVAQLRVDASRDEAAAIESRGKAAADVVAFKNGAEAAGWKRSVEAFGGNGGQFAQYVLYQKMAGAYQSMMVNTLDSPIMKIFESFANADGSGPAPAGSPTANSPTTRTAERPNATKPKERDTTERPAPVSKPST